MPVHAPVRALARAALATFFAALIAAGCGTTPAGGAADVLWPRGDAGAAGDLSDAPGAAADGDAAGPADAVLDDGGQSAVHSDAENSNDAGSPDDAESPEDAGSPDDAETAADAALTADDTDTGVAADAGAPPADTAGGDVAADVVIPPSPNPPPDKWGPYKVGTRVKKWFDTKRNRPVTTRLWYPVSETGGSAAKYFDVGLIKVSGKAIDKGTADKAKGPFPLVLFSHGFKGINWQSYDYTEYLASHGYVVAAPDHQGNTLFDFSADKKTESESALERPKDLLFVYDELVKLNGPGGGDFEGLLDLSKVAVTGHSFGGYTALVAAGATVDVDAAKKRCKTVSNMLCKGGYMDYWPNGKVLKLDKPIPGLKAAICLAPGFHVAFGDKGLKNVTVPVLLFGGTKDDTTPLKGDVQPMYAALPPPKTKVEISGASHMSFTNVCSLPPAQFVPDLKAMCVKPGLIDTAKAFAITDTFGVGWLNRWLKDDLAMGPELKSKWPAKWPEVAAQSSGL